MADLCDPATALRFIARTDIPTFIAHLAVHARAEHFRTGVSARSVLSRHRRLAHA